MRRRMNARGAHVARLLLHPDDPLEVRVALHQLDELGLGERVEELDARDRDVVLPLALLVAVDVVVDLARAEHELGHLLAAVAVGEARVVEHALERALGQLRPGSSWRRAGAAGSSAS